MIKIQIDEKIIKNLEYFNDIVSIYELKLLYNLFKNKYIELNDNNEDSKNLSNLVRIELSNKAGNYISLIFKNKEGKEYKQEWKIGRFLIIIFKTFINKDVEDTVISEITKMILGSYGFELYLKENNFTIEISNKFEKYYNTSNYLSSEGSLGNSCMNDYIETIELYSMIYPSVSIVTINKGNKIAGRCLLWETSSGKYLDRVYLINDLYYYGFYMYMYEKYNIKYNYPRYQFNKLNNLMLVTIPKERIRNYVNKNIKSYREIEEIFLDTMSSCYEDRENIIMHPGTDTFRCIKTFIKTIYNLDYVEITKSGKLSEHNEIIEKYIDDKNDIILYYIFSSIFDFYEDSNKEICFLNVPFDDKVFSYIVLLTSEKNKLLYYLLNSEFHNDLYYILSDLSSCIKDIIDINNDLVFYQTVPIYKYFKIENFDYLDFYEKYSMLDDVMRKDINYIFEKRLSETIFKYLYLFYDNKTNEFVLLVTNSLNYKYYISNEKNHKNKIYFKNIEDMYLFIEKNFI